MTKPIIILSLLVSAMLLSGCGRDSRYISAHILESCQYIHITQVYERKYVDCYPFDITYRQAELLYPGADYVKIYKIDFIPTSSQDD